jgi:hypothetical protein
MSFFKNCIAALLLVVFITGCKGKKKPSLAGEEPVEVGDFIDFFQPTKPAYQFNDSVFQKKEKDSLLISYKVFHQFVPDTLLSKVFGKGVKPKIYPMDRVEVPGAETYLFAKAISGDKKAILVLSFDKKQQFIAGMPLLRPAMSSSTTQSVVIDKKFTITKTVLRKNADGTLSEGKDVYILNAEAKNFMLIMTDALGDKVTELVNPIDTLPRRNKLSADYVISKMNIVSIRDGRKSDRLSFFIHFEKNNDDCIGELRGEAMIKSPTVAEYREGGDPCVLQFNFTTTSVTLKEEGCGSHRGLRCLFDGSYPRKKYIKPLPPKKIPVKK